MCLNKKAAITEDYPEQVIRQLSLRRLAKVFNISEEKLHNTARFGHELNAAPASHFKLNEFDVIDADIRDVADTKILKEMASGQLVIQTVGDYCEHMVRCNAINPKEVAYILRRPIST